MNLWEHREKALQALETELYRETKVIHSLFEMFDNVVERFTLEDTDFLRITGLISIKIRSLCHGLLSLALDGHAQESGALLRPAIEAFELLIYFSMDPTRINQMKEKKLPQAGEIAKKIQGKFMPIRKYLNEHASHFRLEPGSLEHFFHLTPNGDRFLEEPSFNSEVLKENLGTLALFMMITLPVSVACLQQIDIDLANSIRELHEEVGIVFGNEVPNEF
ncbi:hypothetical protein BGM25_23985 [Bacillus sp. FJAT-29953]|nr:hypothetical protein [Bacillus sp. FJAT-29953]